MRQAAVENALTEAFNSLFRAECIRNPVTRPKGGWGSIRDVEIAVAEYVDWFNHRRLHGEIVMLPPVEAEAVYWASNAAVEYAREHVPAEAETN
ncbi:MAG: transposase [Actinobacteria bacterium]|nr:transposase [Actinomycetota bacterium]